MLYWLLITLISLQSDSRDPVKEKPLNTPQTVNDPDRGKSSTSLLLPPKNRFQCAYACCCMFHDVATAAENRLLACRQRGLVQTLPVPWCAGGCMYSAAPLADGVLNHLDAVSWAVQETRAKSRRGNHGVRTTSQHTPFNPHKPAGTVMK